MLTYHFSQGLRSCKLHDDLKNMYIFIILNVSLFFSSGKKTSDLYTKIFCSLNCVTIDTWKKYIWKRIKERKSEAFLLSYRLVWDKFVYWYKHFRLKLYQQILYLICSTQILKLICSFGIIWILIRMHLFSFLSISLFYLI